jgi:heat shock protein HspQ
MNRNIPITEAKFSIGDRVKHALLEYHGLILDVDCHFQHREKLPESLREAVPHQDAPWYHVMVHATQHVTYVAEPHLLADTSEEDFEHPITEMLFDKDASGHYQHRFPLQ